MILSNENDNLNRLTSANSTGGKCNGMDIAWAYDPWGNRTSQSASGTGNCTITQPSLSFDYNNRVSTWGYDADGDVTSDGLNTYTYDAEGRVHSVAGVIYVYDAAGQRVAKEDSSGQVTASYVLGPGGVQVAEVNGSGQWQHSNVYALGHIIATYDASGTRFQLDDALGSRRVQANVDGTVGLSCFTYPYGDGLTCSGPDEDATEQHFTGKEYDAESGNYYFGARYDADNYGRFLTPDWSAKVEPVPYAKLDNPQSLNLYAFVLDNPVSAVDADGHQCSGHKEQNCKAKNKTTAHQQSLKTKTLKFLAKHKTAVKVVSRGIIVGTVISGVVDGGASEAAVPEEAAGDAALETAIDSQTEGAAGEAGEAGQASEGAGAKANDNLNSIEKAQQRVRSGSDGGKRIIDSIQKSVDRLGHMLNRITQGDYDPEDWE